MNQKVQSQTKYSVVLHCTKTNLSEVKDVWFESPPVNTSDIKEHIEKQFSIPVCVQTLSFDGHTLKGSVSLSALRVREGDTFCVDYLARGECSELMEIISWLEQLSNAVTSKSSNLMDIAEIGIRYRLIRNLRSYFSPWSDSPSEKYVNKLHFVHNGGFSMMLTIYKFLLQKPWNEMDENFKYLEHWVVRTLWSFSQTFPLCRLMMQHNAMHLLTKSLLRVRLEEGKMIHSTSSSQRQYHYSQTVQTIFGSIGVLIK